MLRTLAITLAAIIGFGTAASAAPAPAAAAGPAHVERAANTGLAKAQWRRHDRRWDRRHHHERRHMRRHHRPVVCENVRVRYFDGWNWRVRVERQCYPRRWGY